MSDLQLLHPLTAHALSVLADLAQGPIIAREINTGVIDKFQREALAELQNLPSPYKVDKGRKRPFLVITEAGRKALAEKAAK